MKRWEYTLLTGDDEREFITTATRLGLEGWEMVGVSRGPGSLLYDGVLTAAFKRPIRSPKTEVSGG